MSVRRCAQYNMINIVSVLMKLNEIINLDTSTNQKSRQKISTCHPKRELNWPPIRLRKTHFLIKLSQIASHQT